MAYLQLLKEITPWLRYRVGQYHRDTEDVEDAVQDLLLTVHSMRQTYDPSRPFGPWLLGVARRRAFDRLRHQAGRQAHEIPTTEEHAVLPDLPIPQSTKVLADI